MKIAIITATLASLSALASAAPLSIEQAQPPPRADSINLSPLGVLAGNYAVTYEHLWGGEHGLIIEGDIGRSSNDAADQTQFGGGIGYRWHWRGRQNSGFLGVMLAQGFGSGEVSESTTIGNTTTTMRYPMTVRSTTVTANVGKRWMIGDRANITLRFGLGYGHYTAQTSDTSPGAREARDDMNALLAFLPVGFDGELSVGYVF